MPQPVFLDYQPENGKTPDRFLMVSTGFIAEQTRKLGVRNMMILLLIASQTNPQGTLKLPVNELVSMTGLSTKTVETALRELTGTRIQDRALIARTQTRKGDGTFTVPVYQTMPKDATEDTSWAPADEPIPFPEEEYPSGKNYRTVHAETRSFPPAPNNRPVKIAEPLNSKREVVIGRSSEAPALKHTEALSSRQEDVVQTTTNDPRRSAPRTTREGLEEVPVPTPKRKAPARDTVSPKCGADLLAWFLECYQKRYGRLPASINHAALGSRLKGMGTTHGWLTVKEWIRCYFDPEFPGEWRWAKQGHPWNIFCASANQIAATLSGDAKEQAPAPKAEPVAPPTSAVPFVYKRNKALDDIEAELDRVVPLGARQ